MSHPKTIFDVSQPSVVGFLYHKFGKLPGFGGLIKAGLIHRLDKDTDGLLIVAKTEKGLSYFKKLFDDKAHFALEGKPYDNLRKYYKAVCELTKQGERRLKEKEPSNKNEEVIIIRSLVYPKVSAHGYPKMGVTKILSFEFWVLNWKKIIEFDIELLTGRTHQIRYHLAEVWLPIIWDHLYHPDAPKNSELMLTAYGLEFIDCDGKEVKLSIWL